MHKNHILHEVNLFWVICTKALADGDDVEEDHEDGVTEEGESEKKVDSMVRKGSWHSHINMRDRQTEVSLGGKFVIIVGGVYVGALFHFLHHTNHHNFLTFYNFQ